MSTKKGKQVGERKKIRVLSGRGTHGGRVDAHAPLFLDGALHQGDDVVHLGFGTGPESDGLRRRRGAEGSLERIAGGLSLDLY